MAQDWSTYWRSADQPVEAMHAHFARHVYHRHSHETYSFGVTEEGAQSFTCRGAAHTSASGMVMAFNPDDPHDGHAADELGFTYRMIHVGPALMAGVLADAADRPFGLPLFSRPVVDDPVLARRLRALGVALLGGADRLRRDELLARAVVAVVRRATGRPWRSARSTSQDVRRIAERARDHLRDAVPADVTADDLAAVTGHSRFAVYRAFTSVYGMPPSDYQRQLRLRTARRLIARGLPLGEAATLSGFADQSHLTRWFTRCYGMSPGRFREAAR
ncbi:AraC family transcriptional regulator [Planotetraspora kaengkrachanensis]|uniref:AraC family transcriptional regulator n=1 Tax=Planotetraspora kaengkrachanensis TaxID=575193 RepID=A0A8J3Q100_9ACTN|nr:AraC family transcriptional regulator [Planotetraspora kaengkrachanensis]GIG84562.1 AraC family transcriptional regulator [Planotetraspora kaengkrachanensis]